jgi:acetyltransferase-like isoleucine patch superfamily enzyme
LNYHILGNGGFGKELEASIKKRHLTRDVLNFFFYEDDESETAVDKLVKSWESGNYGGEILLAVGSPKLKRKWNNEIDEKFCPKNFVPRGSYAYVFPGHWAGTVLDMDSCDLAAESIILCHGSVITTNVTLGKCVILNLNVTIGHDSIIGDYTTIHPGCNISGNVEISEGCEIGTGSVIIPGVFLPPNGVVAAGSCVTKSPCELYDFDLAKNQLWDGEKFVYSWNDVDSYMLAGSPAVVKKINGVKVG